jgi:hypothetical protein
MWWLDVVIAGLVGWIDLVPLVNFFATPLAWLLVFAR